MLGPPDDSLGLWTYVRAHGSRLTAEELVHLFGREYRRGEGELCEQVAGLLLGLRPDGSPTGRSHCEPIIRSVARGMGLVSRPDELDEFRARCYAALCEALISDSPFWGERFGLALKCCCIDVGRRLRREIDRFSRLESDGEIAADEPDREDESGESFTEIDDRDWLARALRCLPRRERRVIWLHYLKKLPVESIDPAVRTVAIVLGITGRMVRKYLQRARSRLAAMDRRVPC